MFCRRQTRATSPRLSLLSHDSKRILTFEGRSSASAALPFPVGTGSGETPQTRGYRQPVCRQPPPLQLRSHGQRPIPPGLIHRVRPGRCRQAPGRGYHIDLVRTCSISVTAPPAHFSIHLTVPQIIARGTQRPRIQADAFTASNSAAPIHKRRYCTQTNGGQTCTFQPPVRRRRGISLTTSKTHYR